MCDWFEAVIVEGALLEVLIENKLRASYEEDLVGYDEQLAPAMAYVLGGSLICSDMKAAKQVELKAFTVNLEATLQDKFSGGKLQLSHCALYASQIAYCCCSCYTTIRSRPSTTTRRQ